VSAQALGDRTVEDEWDMHQHREEGIASTDSKWVSQFGPKNRERQVCRIWASKPWTGSRGGMWRHWKACVETKRLHEGPVAIRCMESIMDHFVPWLSDSRQIPRDNLGMCNGSINKDSDCPT
jgi:hypothetical protein